MKKFIKRLLFVPLAFAMVLSSLLLVACKEPDNRNLNVSSTVKADTEAVISFIKDKIYNNKTTFGSQTNYTVAEVKEKAGDYANFNYYVEVGTLQNFDSVSLVKFSGTEYQDDTTFKLSVGNSNFIVDKAFFVTDSKLYVAAPIIAFESTASSKVTINDKELDLNFTPATEQLQINSVAFQKGATGSVERVGETNEFNATFKEFNKWIEIRYTNSESTDVLLTKKVLNGQLLSYGFTTVDNGGTAENPLYVLAYYACPYYGSFTKDQYNSVRDNYNGKTCEYFIYGVGKGSAKININYIIPEYQEA